MQSIINTLKSKLTWIIVLTFVIGGVQAIASHDATGYATMVLSVLGIVLQHLETNA